MDIWHISDTHNQHNELRYIPAVEMVIHSGDGSTHKDSMVNEGEFQKFIKWFADLPIKHKIFVAGNHDVVTERFRYWPLQIKDMGITYLENDDVTIDGFKIWGSPYTPTYNTGWAWNMARHKTNRIWDMIPTDTDIVVTHGPPKGILDNTLNRKNQFESVGDTALGKAIDRVNPRAHLFGHVHNTKWIKNSGRFISPDNRIYSNGCVVEDGKFGEPLISHGNIISL